MVFHVPKQETSYASVNRFSTFLYLEGDLFKCVRHRRIDQRLEYLRYRGTLLFVSQDYARFSSRANRASVITSWLIVTSNYSPRMTRVLALSSSRSFFQDTVRDEASPSGGMRIDRVKKKKEKKKKYVKGGKGLMIAH